MIQKSIPERVIVIQDDTINNVARYFFTDSAGWMIAAIVSVVYVGGVLTG